MVVLHFQLATATGTSLRRGFRMVSSATIFTTSQQSTAPYRLLVGLAGSMIYAPYRTLKCQKRKYTISKILQLKKFVQLLYSRVNSTLHEFLASRDISSGFRN